MMLPEEVIAIIPARGGSKGIPAKNLQKIGGIPLIGRAVLAACGSSRIGTVYVSSDDPEILAAAKHYGAKPILRPAAISGDTASSEAALLHGLQELEKEGIRPKLLIFIQCTSPFLGSSEVGRVVEMFDNPAITCALSVTADHGFLWKRNPDGTAGGINHDEKLPRKRRQELAPQFRENGAVYGMRVESFLKVGRRFCGPVGMVETTMPTLEIDEPADIVVAQAWLERSTSTPSITDGSLQKVRALVTDFDGVHTNDTVTVDQNGKESVTCSRADGLGIERLRKEGVKIMILSKEMNPVVTARAEKLKVECRQGIENKKEELMRWGQEHGLLPEEIAYIGNDINDLEVLRSVGVSIAPSDAHAEVLAEVGWKLTAVGGRGALREVSDQIIKVRKKTSQAAVKKT